MPRGSAGYSRRRRRGAATATGAGGDDEKGASAGAATGTGTGAAHDEAAGSGKQQEKAVRKRPPRKKAAVLKGSGSGVPGDEDTDKDEPLISEGENVWIQRKRRREQLLDEQNLSDTESDVPSDPETDDECFSVTRALRDEEFLTNEEYLKLRKERIEKLLQIYHFQYFQLKSQLKQKYREFLRQRNLVINNLMHSPSNAPLEQQVKVLSAGEQQEQQQPTATSGATPIQQVPSAAQQEPEYSVRIKLRERPPYNAAQHLKQLQECLVKMPERPPAEALECIKVTKFDSSGNPLCSYSTCQGQRILLSEFCFKHILYDQNQQLYTMGLGGMQDPSLLYSNSIIDSHSDMFPIGDSQSGASISTNIKRTKRFAIVEEKKKQPKRAAAMSKKTSEMIGRLLDADDADDFEDGRQEELQIQAPATAVISKQDTTVTTLQPEEQKQNGANKQDTSTVPQETTALTPSNSVQHEHREEKGFEEQEINLDGDGYAMDVS